MGVFGQDGEYLFSHIVTGEVKLIQKPLIGLYTDISALLSKETWESPRGHFTQPKLFKKNSANIPNT